jgi:hypothetical protein
MQQIQTRFIDFLFEYLDTGVFRNKSNKNYMEAYDKVLSLSEREDNSDHIYEFYVKTIADYTQQVYTNNLRHLNGTELLDAFNKRWENHKMLIYWMRKIFTYLDRYHVKNKGVVPLFQVGLNIFKEKIFAGLADKLTVAIIHQINRERDGELIDRFRVKEALLCFVQIGLTGTEITMLNEKDGKRLVWQGKNDHRQYETLFQVRFLEDSRHYYSAKSAGWISSMSCPEYLNAANRALTDEEDRADKFMDPMTKPKLLAIVQAEVVEHNAGTLSEMQGTGCIDMFKHDRHEELKLMYSIFKRVESTLHFMTDKMGPYIESRGAVLVSDQQLQNDAIEYTRALLAFKKEIDNMVEYSFENNAHFQRSRDLSFQNFMNRCKFSAPFIASYCDNEMRKGLKGVGEQDTELRLEAIIRLFVCLHDRDVFIRNYTRYLAKRLLDGTSVSDEAEQSMIAKLKVECGHNIVNKISNMFADIRLSRDIMTSFRGLRHSGQPGGVALGVQVLRSGCWPDQKSEPCKIPNELSQCTRAFEEYYHSQHQGRNVTWLLGFGQCEIGTNFAKRNYTCIVSPFQASALLLFNTYGSLSVSQIHEATNLTDSSLKAHLIQFFNPKNKLLNKSTKGKSLEDAELVEVNMAFTCNSIKINFIPKKVKKEDHESKEEDAAISVERKNILDSVIVRIMKGRRTLKHQELITEVMRQVNHFRPQPPMIKAQIESLIQREFLERDANDRQTYIYKP